jgi:hypothetical protein
MLRKFSYMVWLTPVVGRDQLAIRTHAQAAHRLPRVHLTSASLNGLRAA